MELKGNMKAEQFGELLADAVILRHTKEEDIKWYKNLFPQTDEFILIKESLIYEFFLMVLSLELHFKEDKFGQETADYFNLYFAKRLIKNGLFKDYAEYKEFSQPRIGAYNKASRENREPNYIYWIGKTFCGYCGKDSDPITNLRFIAAYPGSLKLNLVFIRDLEKK